MADENAPRELFATTRWTVVLAAGQCDAPLADAALEELCRTYWFPLYAYVRRRGHVREDAEDLVQEFFARFLAKNHLTALGAEHGRFRAFLLASLKHFLANEWKKSQRLKRGGGEAVLSLDWQAADTEFRVAASEPSPEQAFDREWAVALLDKVLERLSDESSAAGKAGQFEVLKTFLTADADVAHAAAAQELGMDAGAVRVAVHRLRKRYRQLLRDEIGHTLTDVSMVDEEMRALFGAFTDRAS